MNVVIVKLYIRNNSRVSKPAIFGIVSTVTCDKDIFSLNEMKSVTLHEIGLFNYTAYDHITISLYHCIIESLSGAVPK